ncbi:IclR family transcriptional regulator [Pseudarthrobacter oxydans]|uniref:IclR family transcriptional regulator n=1 Tax=Pseudarthrobacter oxydans TaxID=1671 RepID=UPI003ECFB3EA
MARASAGRSTLSRHLQVLGAFTTNVTFLTISQLSLRSGLPLATTHRLIAELVDQGLLERQDDRTYRLGVRLWELASRTPGALGLREIALPHLQEVHMTVRQHAQLGILQGRDALFLERLSWPDSVVNITIIGGRLPLHASACGLVLLAHASRDLQEEILSADLVKFTELTITSPVELRHLLSRVRQEGYSTSNGFIHPEVIGIAVPVYGIAGDVIAAISVIVPKDDKPVRPRVELLRNGSQRISAGLRAANGNGR